MNLPDISIIVPIYNVELFLEECLESIYGLNITTAEIILVNDGSTDRSLEIAQKYHQTYPRNTKLITRTNGGLSAARNTGLEHATGEWIAFLDSDDFIDPHAFERVLYKTKCTSADIIAFSGYRYVHETGVRLPLHLKTNPFMNKGIIDSRLYLSTMLQIGSTNIVTVWDKIYRHSTLKKFNLRFIEGIFHEDIPFTFELLMKNCPMEYINENALYYRQRVGSIMSIQNNKKLFDKIKIAEKLIQNFESEGVIDKNINGYLVHLIRQNILNGSAPPFKILNAVFKKRLSQKKRFILILAYLSSTIISIKNIINKRLPFNNK